MDIILLTAYRTTGKDTFYSQYFAPYDGERFPWLVYSRDNSLPEFAPRAQASFARPIKDKICSIFSMNYETLERVKDSPIPGNNVTYRDMMIRIANEAKAKDPAVWAKEFYKTLEPTASVVITDWRFVVEFECSKQVAERVTTIRLFRSDTSEPPSAFEHELDNVPTTYLLVKSVEEFQKLVQIMPVYVDYVLSGIIS